MGFTPPVDCGTPPDLDNGTPDFSATVLGAIATYTCDEGYRLATTVNQRICMKSGGWSEEDIQCEAGNVEPFWGRNA